MMRQVHTCKFSARIIKLIHHGQVTTGVLVNDASSNIFGSLLLTWFNLNLDMDKCKKCLKVSWYTEMSLYEYIK